MNAYQVSILSILFGEASSWSYYFLLWTCSTIIYPFLCSVVSTSRPCSTSGSSSPLSGPWGYLASSVTNSTGCGGPHHPWRVQARPGQRINLTLLNFAWAEHARGAGDSLACDSIGHVSDQTLPASQTVVCAGSQRRRHLLTTVSNSVNISLLPSNQRQPGTNFIIA